LRVAQRIVVFEKGKRHGSKYSYTVVK